MIENQFAVKGLQQFCVSRNGIAWIDRQPDSTRAKDSQQGQECDRRIGRQDPNVCGFIVAVGMDRRGDTVRDSVTSRNPMLADQAVWCGERVDCATPAKTSVAGNG